jgi:undecaprenyl-diphosphatase
VGLLRGAAAFYLCAPLHRRIAAIPNLSSLLARVEVKALAVWIALAGAGWAFLKLASEMREGELNTFDLAILDALRVPGQPHTPIGPHWLTEVMRDITALGGVTLLTIIVVLSVILLLLHQKRREALVLAGVVIAAQLSSNLFKLFYARVRPSFAIYGDLPLSNSFPSGHSTTSAATYFLLAVIVARFEVSPAVKTVIFVLAGLLTIAVGISRVYLGVHWPSDVLGGWTLGAAAALLARQLFLTETRRP